MTQKIHKLKGSPRLIENPETEKQIIKIWKDNGAYIVTSNEENYVVFRGTEQEAMAFVENHPNGLTKAEARKLAQL